MVVKVKLTGLNRRRSREKWYVSLRRTGETLVKGFEGTSSDLQKHMESQDFLRLYLASRNRGKRLVYSDGTLGALIQWFKEECPRWSRLSDHSKSDYEATFDFLEPEFDFFTADLTQPDIYTTRNKAAKAKWPRFADKVVTNLSTVFSEAVKVGKMGTNPAAGVEKLHKADPNANHEWRDEEVAVVLARAPAHLLTPLILARYQGFRGQTCAALSWREYVPDQRFEKAFVATIRKNSEPVWFPAAPETIKHLGSLTKTSTFICTNSRSQPWKDERTLEGKISRFLKTLKEERLIRPGCTLHGLRVTFAAAIKRRGYDDEAVANALGDRSIAMGRHYTRHVEREALLVDIFTPKSAVQNS